MQQALPQALRLQPSPGSLLAGRAPGSSVFGALARLGLLYLHDYLAEEPAFRESTSRPRPGSGSVPARPFPASRFSLRPARPAPGRAAERLAALHVSAPEHREGTGAAAARQLGAATPRWPPPSPRPGRAGGAPPLGVAVAAGTARRHHLRGERAGGLAAEVVRLVPGADCSAEPSPGAAARRHGGEGAVGSALVGAWAPRNGGRCPRDESVSYRGPR